MVPWAHLSPRPKWHFDWFSRFCRANDHDRQTDWQTDHATLSVYSTVMQRKTCLRSGNWELWQRFPGATCSWRLTRCVPNTASTTWTSTTRTRTSASGRATSSTPTRSDRWCSRRTRRCRWHALCSWLRPSDASLTRWISITCRATARPIKPKKVCGTQRHASNTRLHIFSDTLLFLHFFSIYQGWKKSWFKKK